jgi:hypothetical protein
MLNTIMIIDCDQCGQQSESLAVSLHPRDNAEAATMLTTTIQEDGWHIFHDRYLCPSCISEDSTSWNLFRLCTK